jgi:formate dehydrogenase maturation protein FdhE
MTDAKSEAEQVPPCPACGCRDVYSDMARPGEREKPLFLRCFQCGRERADLDFYEQFGE